MTEDQALGRLHEILARPEYQVERSIPWWQQILGLVLELLWSVLARVFQMVGDTTSGGEGALGWAVVGLCALLFASVLVYLAPAVRLTVAREKRLEPARPAERRVWSDDLWQ